MNIRLSSIALTAIFALCAIVFFALNKNESGASGERPGPTSTITEEITPESDNVSFLFDSSDSEQERGTLQRLSEKYPQNRFLQAIINPAAGEKTQKRLYAMAESIQSGHASSGQIKEYYRERLDEITDELEILSELEDRKGAWERIQQLEQAAKSLSEVQADTIERANRNFN